MYTYGTWAFTSGRRAMQGEIRSAMEAIVDENDLPKLLGVLPAEVPDSRPPSYTEDVADQAAKQVVEQQQQRRLE